MSISEITKKTRKREHLTQAAFGEAIGVQKATVSAWERGERRPQYRFLISISVHYPGWRRDWALKCLDNYPEFQ